MTIIASKRAKNKLQECSNNLARFTQMQYSKWVAQSRSTNSNIVFYVLLIGVIVGAITFGFGVPGKYDPSAPQSLFVDNPTKEPAKSSLQMQTPITITMTPAPVIAQPTQGSQGPGPTNSACSPTVIDPGNAKCFNPLLQVFCICTQDPCGNTHCQDDKPVIYLYPQKTTTVNVTLTLNGSITKSIPPYPQNGWRHVEAHHDGTLVYQGQQYSELFYESTADNFSPPQNGFIIPRAELSEKLFEYVTKLGLTKPESQEFLDWWVPKLSKLDASYIFFSVFPPLEKEKFDHVTITPAPDTFISFIAFFRPVYFPDPTREPFVFPNVSPRRGFTAVQWGGILAH